MSTLDRDAFRPYVERFNRYDEELVVQHIDNASAWAWLWENVPFFECPDKDLEETYYFRWWTYRKHIKGTPDGFIITEFLPSVPWARKHNSINCPAGHHLYEGRWLHDAQYLDDYALFWFRKGGEPRQYSFWAADALYNRYLVNGERGLVLDLLPDLVENYRAWERGWETTGARGDGEARLGPDGLFWQRDGLDGMELSIGGHGYRPTINSYMYGDAVAIAQIAELAGHEAWAERFRDRAGRIKELVQERLWDREAQFFKTLPRGEEELVDVRELYGYTPWYFCLPDEGYEEAWRQLTDPDGFHAPYGPTTAEQRHPQFAVSYEGHECQWNGPSWPYATSITLTALANLLNSYEQDVVSKQDYLDLLRIYARCHRLRQANGRNVPWIDENLNPHTGDWIARTRLKTWKDGTWDPAKGGRERGKDYNHSTFCDLVITGLVGLRPRPDDVVEVSPLVPEGTWSHFCLDHVAYHGHLITVLYDRTGEHYGRGQGLQILCDGEPVARARKLGRLTAKLPN